MTSTVVSIIEIYKTKMRSLKLITKGNAQKLMVISGFGCKFQDLDYFEHDHFFMFFEFIIHFRSSSTIFVKNQHFNVVLIV